MTDKWLLASGNEWSLESVFRLFSDLVLVEAPICLNGAGLYLFQGGHITVLGMDVAPAAVAWSGSRGWTSGYHLRSTETSLVAPRPTLDMLWETLRVDRHAFFLRER